MAALNELSEEWQHVWRRQPGAAVRSTLLWHTALGKLPSKGKGYTAQVNEAQRLVVGLKRLEAYGGQHVQAVNVEGASQNGNKAR